MSLSRRVVRAEAAPVPHHRAPGDRRSFKVEFEIVDIRRRRAIGVVRGYGSDPLQVLRLARDQFAAHSGAEYAAGEETLYLVQQPGPAFDIFLFDCPGPVKTGM